MADDLEHIGPHIKVGEPSGPLGPEDWTPEGQAKLTEELAQIPFNPEHANPDFADREVVIEDQQERVHAYNNFPMILTIVDGIRKKNEASEYDAFEAAYAKVANERHYYEIFGTLEDKYPALYKRTAQIARSGKEPILIRGRELTLDEKMFIQSQTYSAAAIIAQQLDPKYDLTFLSR